MFKIVYSYFKPLLIKYKCIRFTCVVCICSQVTGCTIYFCIKLKYKKNPYLHYLAFLDMFPKPHLFFYWPTMSHYQTRCLFLKLPVLNSFPKYFLYPGLSLELSDREKFSGFQGEVLIQIFYFPIYVLRIWTSPTAQNREKWASLGRFFSPKSPPR